MCQKNRVTSIKILPHRKTWHLIECGIQTVTSNNMWDNIDGIIRVIKYRLDVAF